MHINTDIPKFLTVFLMFFLCSSAYGSSENTLQDKNLVPESSSPSGSLPVQTTTLYERLGGIYAIASVVDDFIDRVYKDEILNANPAIAEARDRVSKAGLKYQVTSLVCQSTGGPQVYIGRNMKDAHAHLNIIENEWQAMLNDFKQTLDKFKISESDQQALIDIVNGTKADIVTH